MNRLKSRADFLRAQKGVRRVMPTLTLEACPAPEPVADTLRVGFTASRKVGNAVVRNRAKRRLRAAAQQILPSAGAAGRDYVLVARPGTLTGAFAALLKDLASAVAAAHVRLDAKGEAS